MKQISGKTCFSLNFQMLHLIEPDQSSEYAQMLASSLEAALQVDKIRGECVSYRIFRKIFFF